MSELSFSSKNPKFSGLDIVADFFHVCFFILSHPLYFSYFIFFSPYLLKLLSFLSPLFITTALLVLAYLTVSPNSSSELPKIKVGTCCLVTTYQTVVAKLKFSKVDDGDDLDHEEFRFFEELEVYKIVFDTSNLETRESPVEESCSVQAFDAPIDESYSLGGNGSTGYFFEASSAVLVEAREIPAEKNCSSQVSDAPVDERLGFEGNGSNGSFLEASSAILDEIRDNPGEKNCSLQVSGAPIDESSSLECKGTTGNVLAAVRLYEKAVEEEKEVKPLSAYFDKVEDEKEKRSMRRESKDRDMGADDGGFRSKSMVINGVKAMEDSQIVGPNLGSFGSMRKEKEWRRTLACKLFEERHQNVDEGGEGMDMLWETYDETESSKVVQGINKNKSKKQGKKINGNKVDHNEVVDDEEEDEEMDNVQLCCLQALKFSAGKMNLGHVGRPNLVKITKALKGFGWLHHVTKHSKKGYH